MKRLAFMLMLTFLSAAFLMAATPPGVVNYQGVLRDASGNALDGTYDMEFRFYDGSDSGTATLLLTDTHAAAGSGAVTVSGGLFNVGLGSGTLTAGSETTLFGVFGNNAAVWVEVQVGAETLAPLVEVRSSGFALNASALEGQGSEDFLSAVNDDTALGKLTINGGINLGDTMNINHTNSDYLLTVENDTNSGVYWEATSNRWYWHWNGAAVGYMDLDQGLLNSSYLNITGSSTLGSGSGDWLTLNGRVNGNIDPALNANFDLGAVSQGWDEIFLTGGVRFSGPDQMLFTLENDSDSGVFWGSAANTWEYMWNGATVGYFDLDNGFLRWGGDAYFDSSVILGNASTDSIVFNGRINSHLLPLTDAVSDVGAVSTRWRNLYLSGDILDGGGSPLYLKKDVTESTTGNFTFSAPTFSSLVSGGALYVNPSSAGAGHTLFGVSLAGAQRLRLDEDGDLELFNNLDVEGQIIAGNQGLYSGSAAIRVDHQDSVLGGKAIDILYDNTHSSSVSYGLRSTANLPTASNTSTIRSIYGIAGGVSTSAGTQYGVAGEAIDVNGATHYGVFGEGSNGSTSYGVVGQSNDTPLQARDGSGNPVLTTLAGGRTTVLELQVSNDAGIGATPVTEWALNVDQSSSTAGTGGVKADGAYGPTRGYLAAQGGLDFDGITTLDIDGQEIGVLGVSNGTSTTDNYGLYGYSNGVGVRAIHSVDEDSWADLAITNYGIDAHGGLAGGLFTDSTSNNWAAVGGETTKISGPGSVAFVQNHPYQRDKVVVYHAPESAEVGTYTRGSSRLENGEAVVDLDPTFAWVTNPGLGLTVQLTPRGQWADLYVDSITTTRLVVKSRDGTADGVEFDYMVHGLRIGFEEVSILQPKRFEARIPFMGDHQDRFNQDPGLYQYTAQARFEKNLEALGRAPLENQEERLGLLQAIGVSDPAIHPTPTFSKNRNTVQEDPVAVPEPAKVLPLPIKDTQPLPVGTIATPGHDKIRVDGEGNLYATSFRPDQSQIAQNQLVSGAVEAGDVLVVNRAAPDQLIPCAEEADAGVVGIAVASPGLNLKDQGRDRQAADQAPLALGGVVLCKVDAAYGAVQIGDLLVTSPTPGHAQRSDSPVAGTVVGKALEELEEGSGLIRVLVMLR